MSMKVISDKKEVRTAAVIAEFNPFHAGHAYLLDEIRRKTGCQNLIVLMSGPFVQRGEPACFPPAFRTDMALLAGADLVLELPLYASVGSAAYFADGAVRILDGLGCVDLLAFGCEREAVNGLDRAARILAFESGEYRENLRSALRQGMSFPAARCQAVLAGMEEEDPQYEAVRHVLSNPNATLALEYEISLIRRGSKMTPFPIERIGAGYHDPMYRENSSKYPSASGIRHEIFTAKDRSRSDYRAWAGEMNARLTGRIEENEFHPISVDALDSLWNEKLLSAAVEPGILDLVWDLSEPLKNRLKKRPVQFQSFRDCCEKLKTKDFPYSRISRSLLHLILGMTNDKAKAFQKEDAAYVRILGLNPESKILSDIKSHSGIPIITKLTSAEREYEGTSVCRFLKEDLKAWEYYRLLYWLQNEEELPEVHQIPVRILNSAKKDGQEQ